MLRTAFLALLSHWRRKPLQLAMLLLGLSLATALWSGVQAINAEARASYARAAAMLGQNRLSDIQRKDGRPIPISTYVALRRAGLLVSPVLEGEMRLGTFRLRLIGIDPLTIPSVAQPVDLRGDGNINRFLLPPGQIAVSQATADALQGQSLPPLDIVKDLPFATGFTDIGRAQALLAQRDGLTRLIVSPEQPISQQQLAALAPELRLKSPDGEGDLARLTDSFHLNLTAFGLLSFVVGLFIVYAAVRLAFEQRRPTFRTLRSLGLSASALMLLLFMELLVFALAAGVAGVALGYVVASVLLPDVALTLRGLYGADVPGTLAFRPQWWVTGIGIAVVGTLASAGQSLWQVWRMPLLAPAQPRAWAMASERAWFLQALASAVLFAVTLILMKFGHGLVAGFATLGALLLASALALPVILVPVLRLMQSLAKRPVWQWFWADTRQQLPSLSLALMALLLALSANVGVGTMVSSFRLTFVGWLDQRLAAELYVTARNDNEAERLQAWLAPRVKAVLPIWNAQGEVGGKTVVIHGVVDDATYRDHWPMLAATPDVWDRLARGEGALINEQMMRREGLAVGEEITLPGGWKPRILGVYSDYGNPNEDVIVTQSELVSRFSDLSRLRFGLRIRPEQTGALRETLMTEFGLPPDNVVDQAVIKARSLAIFEKTFAVTAALNVLTLGVAGLAMFASLMTLSGMRLPQIAPVWAMGLTRRAITGLELARTLILAGFTLVAALPVGLGLAWVLLAIVNVEAFGWRLPMHVFPVQWLWLGGFALLASLLSALIPLAGIARLKPSDLLKVFANER
ncbi:MULTISPECIES: ABC transporter permease [Rhizobium/Agrobacterium group]|uniref:ABC transporter membrane spanning protein n=2 Tax=Rhizobium/Agrobacterium group TaxID=227290 RepID=B9K305_ALLAM|nr:MULTISPECIES: FtsX-like permease family protein [Rhizobium/Agrobacterium group]ACM39253.1 ABC transporter membrane spanning protein [Allorhizobium ampelinum S4]MCF1445357.1 ABC transporter permease [Allorhizobium ampelinum]MCF1494187.1 ABC transporter permease [Allorhizobium ampelinum]MUO27110.1 FtsX-like permease family protein [Agrobacterium vitis]MUO40528.1 FtsX-like permease family protein [Agrobacterium vitis]